MGAEMLRNSLVRKALVASGIATLMLSSTLVAGAATTTGTYNAANAKLVPASLAGKTLQIATDPSYAPDESMSGSKIIGFDIDLMNAVAVTLGLKRLTLVLHSRHARQTRPEKFFHSQLRLKPTLRFLLARQMLDSSTVRLLAT